MKIAAIPSHVPQPACLLAAALIMASSAPAAILYWDPNTSTALWGTVANTGTWGKDAYWSTDSSGAFATGITNTTTSVDVLRVNAGNLNGFTMSVTGDVLAQSLYFQNNGGSVSGKIDGLGVGTLHLYGSGIASPAIDGTNNDTNFVIEDPIVLEQAASSTVYLGVGGGNNGSVRTTKEISSTNSVNLYFNCTGNSTHDGPLNVLGSITCNQAGTGQFRSVTINGIIGSGVTDVTQSGSSTVANTGLTLNNSNLFTGNTTVNNGTLSITGTNSYTGKTIVNGGIFKVSGAAGSINTSSAIILNGGNLTLTNTSSPQGSLDRVKDTATITSTGGTLTYTNTSGNTYAETLGALTLAAGQLNAALSNNMTTGAQTLTLSGLTQSGQASATFSAAGGLNATANMIKVSGVAATTAGQIIAPWATTGTTAALQSDYAIYDASSNIVAANIAATTEDAWNGGTTDNFTSDSISTTLSGSRRMNSWRYNAAAGALILDANNFDTNGILNGGLGLLTISGTGAVRQLGTAAANLFITTGNSAITISAPIQDNSGALTLVKSGSTGTLILSGANNYTGGTVINAGTLQYGALGAITSGPVTVAGGILDILATSATVGTVTLASGSIIGTGTLTGSSYHLTDSGTISAKLGGSLVGLTKTGAGTAVLSGVSTYTGVTTINEGVLSVTTIGNSGVTSNLGQAASAATSLVLGGGTLRYTGATATTNRSITLSDATSSAIEVVTNILTISGASATTTTGALVKAGAGTLILSGANLHSGLTTVADGTLAYGISNALGSGAVTVLGGILDLKTFSDSVGAVTLNGGTIAGTTAVLTGTSYSLTTGTVSAILAGDATVNLAKTGAATALLTGANTYAGTTTVSAGTLLATKAATLPGYNTPAKIVVAGGTLAVPVGAASDWTTAEVDALLASASKTSGALGIDTSNATGGNLTQWTAFTASNLGTTLGLTKLGSNTLTLDLANTYPGATTVRTGTLLVNGSTDAASAVTVAPGGTLGGTGTVNGTVSCAGKIAPGAGAGTLHTGAMTLSGTLAVEVDDILCDKLIVNGPLNLAGATLTMDVLPGGFTQGSYIIASATSLTGTFAGVPAGYSLAYTATQAILNRGEPEIAVEQPESTDLANNGLQDFGAVPVGSNTSLVFTLRNTGSADLSVLAITTSGTHKADFTVSASTLPLQVPGPDTTTTFTVQFAPGGTGVRTATIHIANNDANENPFLINLSGSGSGSTPYDDWAQIKITAINATADASPGGDPDGDGKSNLYEFAFNGDPLNAADTGGVHVLIEDSSADSETLNKELILTIVARKDAVFTAGSPATSALVDGITYVIEGSVNLLDFTTGVTPVAPVVTGLPADVWTDYDYFSFSLAGSNGLPGKGFLRAGVVP